MTKGRAVKKDYVESNVFAFGLFSLLIIIFVACLFLAWNIDRLQSQITSLNNSVPHKYCHNETQGLVCNIKTPTKYATVIPSFFVDDSNGTINATKFNTAFKLDGEPATANCIPYNKEVCEIK